MALWSLVVGLAATTSLGTEAPEVVTPAGRLRGISEGEVHVFRGIPYAEAPVGALRWRPPVSLRPWQGVRDASRKGSPCLSVKWNDFKEEGGSEDCLFLNVYLPSGARNTSQLPCLVWIHGGGYEFGSSNDVNGSNLVSFWQSQQSPALLVTLNYRLNVFGFLGSDQLRDRDPLRSTGNYGLQDQRLALRWVQENIAAFGGDPKKVMIFGQSAGAGSVSTQIAMHKSNGLYSAAIMESGGFSGWAAQPMQRKEFWFQQLLNHSKCSGVECLLNLSGKELISAYMAIPHGRCCGNLFGDPYIPWAPAIDGVELIDHPFELVKQGKVNAVPSIIGTTLDDGGTFSTPDYNLSTQEFLALFEDKYGSSHAAEMYQSESHADLPGLSDGWWFAERVVTDQNFFCTSHLAGQHLARTIPVFRYLFASSATGQLVAHSSELPFVFMNFSALPSAEDNQLAKEVAMSWYHFAASGDPGIVGGTAWKKLSAKAAPMLKFQVASKGGSQVIDDNYRDAQCAFMIDWLQRNLLDHSRVGLEPYMIDWLQRSLFDHSRVGLEPYLRSPFQGSQEVAV